MERAPPALLILWGSCESSPSVLATNGFFQKLMAPEEDPLHSATWGSPSIMLAAYPRANPVPGKWCHRGEAAFEAASLSWKASRSTSNFAEITGPPGASVSSDVKWVH